MDLVINSLIGSSELWRCSITRDKFSIFGMQQQFTIIIHFKGLWCLTPLTNIF